MRWHISRHHARCKLDSVQTRRQGKRFWYKKKSFFQSRLRETPTHIPVHPKSADRCSCWHKQQRVHSEENYIDLIHLTGPLRYLVIGRLSWSFILWAELQQLPASIKRKIKKKYSPPLLTELISCRVINTNRAAGRGVMHGFFKLLINKAT